MKIISSQLDLQSSHQLQTIQQQQTRLRAWKDFVRVEPKQVGSSTPLRKDKIAASGDRVSISQEATRTMSLAMAQESQTMRRPPQVSPPEIKPEPLPGPPVKLVSPPDPGPEIEAVHDSKMELMRLVIEKFTGQQFKVFAAKSLRPQDKQATAPSPQDEAKQAPARQGWGVEIQVSQINREQEHSEFSAQGIVKTADGQDIAVDVTLRMSREFVEANQVTIQAGDAVKKDPLVVNFSGTAAQLTERSFAFDLDADGQKDQIAFVEPGSGFLVLDRSGDGQINNGAELFGPSSGDGFAELAQFDQDANQFIDEGDAVYERLRIWSRDATGKEQLVALGQRGVGAIYLGKITTPFALNDNQNQSLGQVRSTSIYLQENGGAGTVQQVDLVV